MTAPSAELHIFKPRASRRSTFGGAQSSSRTRLSADAQAAIRHVAIAADASSSSEVRLALVWLELARGVSTIVDGFFTNDRCYLVLKTRLDDQAVPIEGRRLEILEAVLAGSRQKNIAIDLQLAPSTVALNSKLALESLGAPGKPSRAHPLLMILARAANEPVAWSARTATFVVHDDSELRVIGIARPDRRLGDYLPNAELAVIRSLIEGSSYQEIARERGTSTRTIANQISAVFRRMHVSGRNELVQRLFRDDLYRARPTPPSEPLPPNQTIVPPGLFTPAEHVSGGARRTA
ncbi:MAG TPA: LuxR C-terminal-related transcriptional regulator [Polyangiaceae bacterium]|nr:LuxR C-terminal-related transcriptional regulator [Polyangiaceae bacterium]